MRSHANLHLGFLDSERDDGVNLKDKLCFTDYGANTQRRHKFKFPARFSHKLQFSQLCYCLFPPEQNDSQFQGATLVEMRQ